MKQSGRSRDVERAMKLGEALVRDGIITREQLTRALERQVMFGFRIGTNLVELRFVREEELGRFLSRYYRVPAAPVELLQSIPPEVLGTVEAETAAKYKVLPFRVEKKRLSAAMLNPSDVREIDDLRFITGHDIVPHAITEIRLLHALEKYYGIKRELTYISLTDPFNPEAEAAAAATAAAAAESIDKVKAAFAAVRDIDEIAGILISEAYRIASRVAVFALKGGRITGWKGRGLGVEGFKAAADGHSVFADVLRGRSSYRGPILRVPDNEPLIEVLAGTPQDALLLPIVIRDRVAAVIYADNGNNAVLNANIGYLSRLAGIAALAFELIMVRKKILDS